MHRSKLTVIVAAVLVAGLILGVGALALSRPSSPSPDDPVTGTAVSGTPGPPTDTVVTPTPGMANVGPIRFTSASVGADDRTVTVDFISGVEPCSVLDHVDVDEQPDRVVITLFEGSDPASGDVACPEIAMYKSVVVELSAPLDGRKIVDGAKGKSRGPGTAPAMP
jgi:hypothetical protein